MTLPDLSWQFAYGRLAWALVLAALLVAAWPPAWRLPRRALAGIALGAGALVLLPGEASPAWHLGLAFQYPSGVLAGLCLARLLARATGHPGEPPPRALMPLPLAAVLAATGAVLYLDAFGLLSRGYYYAGFGQGAALCAVLLAGACALAIHRGMGRLPGCAILGAIALFSLARLPTGNLWDALLDPLLWGWALVSLGATAVRALLRRAGRAAAAGAPLAGAEPYLPMKE
ncbi:hypothetical protein [Massilia yuzhufengensis]|uniref:Uncharacterized protein n=1 Tax=Massilia yuzhufengensis TaxID=1164594 RepID=A0A1I1N744_9BURK|nr:hypothetical protein [Massilia yuzhufengensis]SFC93166.1 hypothetical protein SAMN05216204_11299 [Massilia yuzhufengensis]